MDSFIGVEIDGVKIAPLKFDAQTVLSLDASDQSIVVPAGPSRIRVDLGADSTRRRVRIWLPTNARVAVIDFGVAPRASLRASDAAGRRWTDHGSSISQCADVDLPMDAWPIAVARHNDVELVSLGLGGQCHLDAAMARCIVDTAPDIVSLEIGINIVGGVTITERTFLPALHDFVDIIRAELPLVPIVLVSPIYCEQLEFEPGPLVMGESGSYFRAQSGAAIGGSLTLGRVREIMKLHVEQRTSAGDDNIRYVDGLELFSAEDAAPPTGCVAP
ncbi:SGNH/GDSL hydrolase family protein [Microbacterium sp. NPDC087589]|uniref:SGNH/GDSL hydrolase family protein n=1 Tax=Microbacterium sp. NPDC087589 TaxID=3364191 RepID=UPI00382DE3B0